MTENTQNLDVKSLDGKGALWTIAGTGIAIAASKLVNGGLFGCGGNAATQAANTAVAMELSEAKSKIAMLEQNAATRNALTDTLYKLDTRVGKLETETPLLHRISDQKIDAVATLANNGIATNTAAINALAATVGGITKIVVPRTAVCPEPMPRYNSWTTPTCDTPTPA